MRERFKAYVTKYALTAGIQVVEVEDCFHISPKMVSLVGTSSHCYHLPEWHRTKEDALAQAEKMRVAKIASLQKAIKKIQALDFETQLIASE